MIKYLLKNTNIRFKFFLILSVLYAIFIFYLSSKSSFGDPKAIFYFLNLESFKTLFYSLEKSNFNFLLFPFYIFYKQPDKLVHLVIYAGFGFLLYFTIKNSSNPKLCNNVMLFAMIIGTLYGLSDEFHQSFVPGRTASTMDLVADSTGVALAQTVIFIKDKLYIRYKSFSIYKKQDASK